MTTWGGTLKQLGLAGLVAGYMLGLCFSGSAAETTYQRLQNAPAEPQNWLRSVYALHSDIRAGWRLERQAPMNIKYSWRHMIEKMINPHRQEEQS